MPRIAAEKIAELRDRLDIERVIGQSVTLHRKGKRLVGLCPFHSEKTPSFGVDPDKKLYHCFGCQAGGDVFDFVMQMEGLDFYQAVILLAKQHGVILVDEEEDPRAKEERQQKQRLYGVNRTAAEFFARELEKDQKATDYLKGERGLTDDTINRFELGWAPDGWQALTDHLRSKQIDEKLGHTLGILGRSENGRTYDRLRGRVIFPIAIPGGELAGFGARRADWISTEGPKYLNSPESPVYDKSSIFYGLHFARDEIRKSRRAILVEGYLDVILLHQVGVPLAIASCGTALSARHALLLKKLANEVVTMYDGDTAGQDATRKAAEILLQEGLTVRVAALPEGDDPDTFARKVGGEGVKKLIDDAPSAIDFFVDRAKSAYKGGGIAGKAKAVDAVKPLLVAIKDPLTRDVSIDACARALGLEPHVLRRHLAGKAEIAPKSSNLAPKEQPKPVTEPPPVHESALLRLFVESPDEVLSALEDRDALHAFTHPAIQVVFDAGIEALRQGTPFDAPRALEAAKASGVVDDGTLKLLRETLMDPAPERNSVETCVKGLLRRRTAIRLRQLSQQISKETDELVLQQLAAESRDLNKLLGTLS